MDQRRRRAAPGFEAVLDIGTSKVACLIAAVTPAPPGEAAAAPAIRVVGVGHQRAQGIKAGVITDLYRAEHAVRATIAQAERMAGIMLEEVAVSVACGRLGSQTFTASAPVAGTMVGDTDLARLYGGGRSYAERDGRTLVYMNEVGLRLDGAVAGRDPRGLAARELAADLHAVTVDEPPLRNTLLVIERSHLTASELVPGPLAAALGVTSPEERRFGVTVVDIGGGTTAIAMFAEDRLLHVSVAPLGGNSLTFDIARSLSTTLAEAERIKALYGTVVGAQSDEHDIVSFPLAGEDEAAHGHTTKAAIGEIIRPRVQAIAQHVAGQIVGSGMGDYAGRCIVLTGGTSQLVGIADFLATALGRPVRVGRPIAVSGLPQAMSSGGFATVAGLLLAAGEGAHGSVAGRGPTGGAESYLGRVGRWLRQGF